MSALAGIAAGAAGKVVGNFVARIIADVSPFSKSMKHAEETSQRLERSTRNLTTTTAMSEAASRSAAATHHAHSSAAGANAVATSSMAAASSAAATANNALLGATGPLGSKLKNNVDPLTQTAKGLLRLALNSGLASKEVKTIARQAALTTGEVGLMEFAILRFLPPMNEFNFALAEFTRSRGYKVMHALSIATLIAEHVMTNLAITASATFTNIGRLAKGVRLNIDTFFGFRSGVAKTTSELMRMGAYLKGAFGPFLSDIGKTFKFTWDAFAVGLRIISAPFRIVMQDWGQFKRDVIGLWGFMTSLPGKLKNVASAISAWSAALVTLNKHSRDSWPRASLVGRLKAVSRVLDEVASSLAKLRIGTAIAKGLGGLSIAFDFFANTAQSVLLAIRGPFAKVKTFLVDMVWMWGEIWADNIRPAFAKGLNFIKEVGVTFSMVFSYGAGIAKKAYASIASAASTGYRAIAAGFSAAMPYLKSFGAGIAYGARETVKAVSTVVRMGAATLWLGNQLRMAAGAAIFHATKSALIGVAWLKNLGIFSRVIKILALGAIASSGFGGAAIAAAAGVAKIAYMIPGLGRVTDFVFKKMALGVAVFSAALTAATGGLAAIISAISLVQFKAGAAIGRTADMIGISTEALIGWRHAAQLTGMTVDEADDGLIRFSNTMIKTADAVAKAKDNLPDMERKLRSIGLSSIELRRMSPDVAMSRFADGLTKISSAAERASLVRDIVGKGSAALVNTLLKGSAGLRAAAKDADKLGLMISRIDAGVIEQANVAVFRLRQLFVGVGRTLAVRVAPFVEALVLKLVNIGTAGSGIGGLVDKGLKMAGNAAVWLANKLESLRIGFVALQGILYNAAATGVRLVAGLTRGFGEFFDFIKWGAYSFGSTMLAVLSDVIDKLATVFEGLPEWVQKAMGGKPEMVRAQANEWSTGLWKRSAELERDRDNMKPSFAATASAMDETAAGMQTKAAMKFMRALQLTGEQLKKPWGERLREFMNEIADDARRRAAERTGQTGKGAGIGEDEFGMDSDTKGGRRDGIAAGNPLIKGTAEAFQATLPKTDSADRIRKQQLDQAKKQTEVQKRQLAIIQANPPLLFNIVGGI